MDAFGVYTEKGFPMIEELRSDALDLLDELKHDLGKYIYLPVGFLPKDASSEAFTSAVHTAIFRTRRAQGTVESAHDIWERFCQEAGNLILHSTSYPRLVQAVDVALSWGNRLSEPLDMVHRECVIRDFQNVGRAIARVQDEIDE